MNLSNIASKVMNLLPAGMNNPTLHLEDVEISLSSLICEEQLFAPLFVTQVACIYREKVKSTLFDFDIKCNNQAPSGMELVDLNYNMLNKQEMETLYDAVSDAFWDFCEVILAGDFANNQVIKCVEKSLTNMKMQASSFSSVIPEKSDLAKLMAIMYDGYADNKYFKLGFELSVGVALGQSQSAEDASDEFDDLFSITEINEDEVKDVELHPVNPTDIFKHADKSVLALINRIGLYAKALGQGVNDALLIAAIGACKPARDMMKRALGLTEAQHLQFPGSIHILYESLCSKVNMRCFDDDDRIQTDWFTFNQVPAMQRTFDESSLYLFSWLFSKEKSSVKFSEAHIDGLVNQARNNQVSELFMEFVELNSISAGARAKMIRAIENEISTRVVGQECARNAMVNIIRKVLTPGAVTSGPVFLYGASGVGKTFLATMLAKAIAQEGLLYDLNIFNMETFGQNRSESQLIGSGSQYGNAIIGELTMPMEFNPNQIFVFDEIEKAHNSVLRSLLTILSARTCVDATTRREVDFSQAIFIFSSNAGQSVMQKNAHHELPLDHTASLSESFSSEFISRMKLGEIVCCKPLSTGNLQEYIENVICPDIQAQYTCSHDLAKGIALLSEGLSPRSISGSKSKIGALIAKEIENALIDNDIDEIGNISLKFVFKTGQYVDISLDAFIAQYHYKTWYVEVTSSYEMLAKDITVILTCDEPRAGIAPEHVSLSFMQITLSSNVRFSDVIGHEHVKEQLSYAIENIKNLTPQDGIMFYGEAGTGKTMMAQALAGEAGVTFISLNAPDITSGDTEANIKKLFEAARRYAPAIIFIDEFDAIAGKRQAGTTGMRLMVSSLLTMLDGFSDSNLGVLTIVASNHPDMIDSAILRPGRISHHLHLSFPDANDIETLMGLFAFADEMNNETLDLVKSLLKGRNIANSMRLFRCLEKLPEVDDSTLRYAVIDEVFGCADDTLYSESRALIAFHEAGHALASHLLTDDITLMVDINTREKRGGFCLTENEKKDERLLNRRDIENKVKVFLAGRAAESLYTGDDNLVSIGAGQDLSQATKLLKVTILNHGMSRTGSLAVAKEFTQSEQNIYNEVDEWMNLLYAQIKALLSLNIKELSLLASALLEKRTLFQGDLCAILPKRTCESKKKSFIQCANYIFN